MWNICLFRLHDLRLEDNPALVQAAESPGNVLPLFVLDPQEEKPLGPASSWWVHQALGRLEKALQGHILFFRGDTREVLRHLHGRITLGGFFCNSSLHSQHQDEALADTAADCGIPFKAFPSLVTLWDPATLYTKNQKPYQVFTPFYKACLAAPPPGRSLKAPVMRLAPLPPEGIPRQQLGLLPTFPWYHGLEEAWPAQETAAWVQQKFFLQGLQGYKSQRDFPDTPGCSRLSPFLAWGEISPRGLWHALTVLQEGSGEDKACFARQIIWREFASYMLWHHPSLETQPFQKPFQQFPWRQGPEVAPLLAAWQQGKTGYPLVDAGMRQLWQTGYMHNRVRMVVASFLVKNLLIHWRLGEAWFRHCLVDAYGPSNILNWQWVAGCGVDAAPYFRIFNPCIQGKTYDAQGHYIRTFVPELQNLPLKFLFSPWEAPPQVLTAAGITLGKTYAFPMVSLVTSRKEALAALETLKTVPS